MRGLLRQLHRDQSGAISIVTVFAVLLLTMLLGMVMNVGRQVDGKIRMQNAADAAAYSGGMVLTRGMNSLAFTNHLLSEVFAMTALMREARDRNAETHVPEILAAWEQVGQELSASGFPKFEALGSAIVQQVPLEQRLVTSFSDWMAEVSRSTLPLMEGILAEELIPRYQRAVVEAFPDIAQAATMEIARRNSQPGTTRGEMLGVLWRSSGEPVGYGSELLDPTLPVVDPVYWPQYADAAAKQRKELANRYRRDWNNRSLRFFARKASLCQFYRLWDGYTCGQLERLLAEYPATNLPLMIRTEGSELIESHDPGLMTAQLEEHFTFLAVVYWRKLPEMMPGVFDRLLFNNPMDNDSLAYAEVRVFVPKRRLVWSGGQWTSSSGEYTDEFGGAPGDFYEVSMGGSGSGGGGSSFQPAHLRWQPGVSQQWNLENQHWTCQLVPATMDNLSGILQAWPPVAFSTGQPVVPPNLGGVSSWDIQSISPH